MSLLTLFNDFILAVMVWSLLSTITLLPIEATESDIWCLKSIKDSLEDPYNNLGSSWDFNNHTEGFICKFTGVDCWHPDENKVLNIKLPDMGLKGPFPRGLQNCTSITGLDLSNNDLYGPIPSDISSIIGFIMTLDLSSNNFSGEIPQAIVNCSLLNVLKLDHNQFVGSIPPRIGLFNRLKTFSVASNRLTGEVPQFINANISAESFANNPGLCGAPLSHCKQHRRWRFDFSFKSGFVIGYVLFFVSVTVASISYCTPWVQVGSRTKRITIATMAMLILRRRMNKQRQVDHVADSTIMQTSQEESKEISRLERLAAPLSYHDISDATNSFSENNVIGSGETGMMYKATLPNGFSLAVKRLKESHFREEQITSELKALGVLRHPNLLPLLGFCVTSVERLMVYKHMPNGNLYDWLHPLPTKDGQPRMLEWPVREKIGLGLARGLTWLHQHENFRIIHNNVCSRSILLDQNFEPKLSNFGEAMIINRKDTFEAGAAGVDRDFWEMAFVKEDVYSFGVVLLELITGQDPSKMTSSRNHSCGGAPFSYEWMSHLLSSFSSHYEAIDKYLIGQGFDAEILQFLQVATDCVQPNPDQRPTMLQIYEHMKTFVKNRAQKNLVYPISTFEV